MLERDSTEPGSMSKTVLILLCSLLVLVVARRIFPELFQCENPACQRTHIGEP